MERNLSYGVIRDVDLDMPEKDILESIFCPEPGKLLSLNRLNRKNFEADGWSPSEAVRLCFKGSYLPPYVYTHGLRIKVEPYVFPVSQCSRCWKYGHVLKRCPSAKVVCPKCGKNHDNCETTSLTCVNCNGRHIYLSKTCPIFLKEKRLRELMSEFNCTYRKALTIYVPKDEPTHKEVNIEVKDSDIKFSTLQVVDTAPTQTTRSLAYAEVTTKAQVYKQKQKSESKQKQKKQENSSDLEFMEWSKTEIEELNEAETKTSSETGEREKHKDINFKELLKRLQEIIFMKGSTIQMIYKGVLKTCIEWVILVVVDNVADWPILKLILDYFSNAR